MSYIPGEEGWGDYAREQYEAELYAEHRQEALEEFTAERLQSYYVAHPDIAVPAVHVLNDARRFRDTDPTVGLLFAAVAIELGLKALLLKPIVYGLVHQDAAASLITDLATSYTGFDRYRGLLLQILANHGGINLQTCRRTGSTRLLWDEITDIQTKRNAFMHRGERPTDADTELAMAVAVTILDSVVPSVLHRLRLHLHEGIRICGNVICRLKTPDPGVA
jgi:hypothetical protein